MESKWLGNKIYLRLDQNDEVLHSILQTCKENNVLSATFSGLGACDEATIGTYIPEEHDFLRHTKNGMLEMVSLMGNVTANSGKSDLNIHAHALFTYYDRDSKKINYFGGDLKKANIMYTGEITIEPIEGGNISKKFDSNVGIEVWNFEKK